SRCGAAMVCTQAGYPAGLAPACGCSAGGSVGDRRSGDQPPIRPGRRSAGTVTSTSSPAASMHGVSVRMADRNLVSSSDADTDRPYTPNSSPAQPSVVRDRAASSTAATSRPNEPTSATAPNGPTGASGTYRPPAMARSAATQPAKGTVNARVPLLSVGFGGSRQAT